MRKKMVKDIVLWGVTSISIVLSFVYFFEWRKTADTPEPVNKWYWIIWGVVALACIAIWFFTKPKEEEISITRGG
ncbi:MAG: hypothetical protein HY650_12270 [Acidobacteria bacterium]|nr:hypothetical protein [Acidobacteriota bacterium]